MLHNNIGISYRDKKMFPEAIEYFKKACVLGPSTYEDPYINLGYVYFNLNDMSRALETWQAGVKAFPNSAEFHVDVSMAAFNKEEFELAIASAKKALALDDRIENAHYFLGLTYNAQDRADEAIKEFKIEIKLYPKNRGAYERLGCILSIKKKDFRKALFYYKKAVQLDSRNGCIYNNLAWYSMQENVNIPQIVEWARKGVELCPSHGGHYGTLGWALYKNGQYDEALQVFQKACSHEAIDALGTGLVHLKKGDKAKASEFLKKAFQRNKHINQAPLFKQEEEFLRTNAMLEEITR